jgi:hypothetical protein
MEDLSMFDLYDSKAEILGHEYIVNIGYEGIPVHSQTDNLVDVTNKLAEARVEAEELNDKLFLYLIDLAIFHAHEVLESQSDLGEHEKWS